MKKIMYILFLAYSMAFQTHAMEITVQQKTKNSQKLAELFQNADIDSNLPKINAILEYGIDPQFKSINQRNLLQLLFIYHAQYERDSIVAHLTNTLISQGCDFNVLIPLVDLPLFDTAFINLMPKTSLALIYNGAPVNTLIDYEAKINQMKIIPHYSCKAARYWEKIKEAIAHNTSNQIDTISNK